MVTKKAQYTYRKKKNNFRMGYFEEDTCLYLLLCSCWCGFTKREYNPTLLLDISLVKIHRIATTTLQENSVILMDILTENEILGIFLGISSEIPRKTKIWVSSAFLRNIPMKYRGNNIPRKIPTNIRRYIIAATEPLGDFKNSEEISRDNRI